MQSKAATVAQYLAELPADRREAIQAVRKLILKNLHKDFEEGMQYGVIGYYVPHRVYPPGYHCDPKQPLPFAGLASQKQNMALYVMFGYEPEQRKKFTDDWKAAGKKLDMGKSCIRFKKVDDLAMDVLANAFRGITAQQHIEWSVTAVRSYKNKSPEEKAAARAAAKAAAQAAKKKPAKSTAKAMPTRPKTRKKAARSK